MLQVVLILLFCLIAGRDKAVAQSVRGAFPSPSIQILPLMVAAERGFFKREGLELELVFVRGATVAVQALIANQIHFIFSIGPQMPAVWEGNDIMLLAQQVGRPTFSLVVTPDIQKITDLKGKKLGVTFGGSTAAGTKALLELNKINPDMLGGRRGGKAAGDQGRRGKEGDLLAHDNDVPRRKALNKV